ncbi:MAG: hypothetical protein E7486_04850 [Ruminococcaceae bacterium]|nr:hypothetical protein [Oscillospiraceae bacterium]
MAKKREETLHWLRLDNAAKIYPAAMRKNWSNVFRQSVTLCEPVDVAVLKSALDVTVKRFPSIAARLRRGAFWYYLQEISEAPEIREEYSYPLVFMDREEMRRCAFRVIVHEDRIAVEFFHSLTDGTGALCFLKTLTAEYLERKHQISIPLEEGILDRTKAPSAEELEDSFLKYAGPVPASRRDTDAWHMDGEPQPSGFLNLTCFRLPVAETLEAAHRHRATATVFLSAVMMKALLNLQKETVPVRYRRKPIKLLIPVNLRQIFPSKSLRNFAMYTIPGVDPRLGDYSLEELCKVVQCKMGLEFTPQHMSSVIATNVNDERNPIVRVIPLPLKNAVMKMVFDRVGEKKSCLTLSNLGQVRLPEVMKPYIRRMDFILGVQAEAPYNCGVLSFGDTVYVNFIRNIREAGLEQHFFRVLQELGIPATVESNRN